jgi:hypothetical protein
MLIDGINYEKIDLHPRYANYGDKIYSYLLDEEDNKIWKIFTVKYVSVDYQSMQKKEFKKLDKKIDSLMENYSEEIKTTITELMEKRNKIKRERSYIRSDELDSNYYKKDLMNCYTFIVTEEEYTNGKPYLLEISTCQIIKKIV